MTGMRRCLLVLALPAPAFAHELTTQYGPLLGPALHVFTEVDHLAAFAAVGLLAGQQPATAQQKVLLAFMAALMAGMCMPFALDGMAAFDAVERELSAISSVVVGVLVAAGLRLRTAVIATAVATLGSVHGLANGLAIAGSTAPLPSLLGAGTAALIVAASATAVSLALRAGLRQGPIVVRVLGSWIAALALMLLGLALRAQ